jgi:hypothetical protein
VFSSWDQSFIIPLFRIKVGLEVGFKVKLVDIRENRFSTVFAFIPLFKTDCSFEILLFFEEGQLFKLRPNEIGLLYLVCEGKPWSSGNETTDHTWVIPLAHEDLEPVLILERDLDNTLVGKVDLPDEVAVVVGLEGNAEELVVPPDWTILLLILFSW